MYGYIYKTTNLYNGKIYVGQHKAKKFNPNYLGSGIRITNVVNKFGKNCFKCELLEECDSEDALNEKEQYWIAKLNSTNRDIGYNLMSGGYKTRGMKHSKATRKKISESKKGCHPNRNYVVSEETKKKISDTFKSKHQSSWNKGIPMREESKEKLRKANLGKIYPEEVRAKHRGRPAWNKGIPMSEEAKKHLSEINKGKKQNLSLEEREQKRLNFLGKNNPRYGKHLSEEERRHISESIKGRIKITNGVINKVVKPEVYEAEYKQLGFYPVKNK